MTPAEKAIHEMFERLPPLAEREALEAGAMMIFDATVDMLAEEWVKRTGVPVTVGTLISKLPHDAAVKGLIGLVGQAWATGTKSAVAISRSQIPPKSASAEPEVEESALARWQAVRDAAYLAGWDGQTDLAKWIESRGFA